MKRYLILLLLSFGFCLPMNGQLANLVIFTELKETFTVTLANERVNQLPVRNLKLTGIPAGVYSVEIIFNNPTLPRVREQIRLSANREMTLVVQQTDQGQWTLQFVNEFGLGYRPIEPQGQMLLAYQSESGGGASKNPAATNSAPLSNSEKNDGEYQVEKPIVVERPIGAVTKPSPMPGYKGKVGCEAPMDATEFQAAKQTIAAKSFSDTKKQVAMQITRANCLQTSQVVELLRLMNFESDKLEFAKFAFEFTYDQGNYYLVNEVFGFENSIRDLEAYLKGKQ